MTGIAGSPIIVLVSPPQIGQSGSVPAALAWSSIVSTMSSTRSGTSNV